MSRVTRTLWAVGVTAVTFVNASSAGSAATTRTAAAYVSPFVSSLPGRSFEETVVTLSAEPVNVAVARIPDSDVANDTPNSQYPVVFQAAFDYDRRLGNGFEHKVVIPPQSAGVYEISLSSKERDAVQRFLVGTLGAIADFETSDSAILPIDTRTMRRRSDVALTGYTNTQAQTFRAGSDGLIHLPNDFYGTNLRNWPLGKLILTSSDGSILPMSYLMAVPPGTRTYFDTDRSVYRGGDRVHYEFISRVPLSNKESVLTLSGPNTNVTQQADIGSRVTTGTLTLPRNVSSGVYRLALGGDLSALSVANTHTSKYEIEVRAATPRVAIGEPVKFVISVRTFSGRPAPGVRIAYAWHFLPYIRGPIPIAQALRMEPHLMRAETATGADGNATITIPSPREPATPVELVVYEPGTGVPIATALAETVARSPQTIVRSVSIVAGGLTDGDAIARIGSAPNFQWQVVSFDHNVTRFTVSPPSDEDRIPVSIMTATDSETVPPEQLVIAMPGEPHRLRIALGCYTRNYADGQPLHICIRIRDWQNRPIRSNVTVTVTEATDADVAAAGGLADAPYDRLYGAPAEMGRLYSSVNTWKTNPPISYLYPETPRALHAGAFVFSFGSAQQFGSSDNESNLQPQTLYWLDQVATDKNGGLTLQLPWPLATRPAMYSVRITAVATRGEVGQAFAFVSYQR